MGPRTPLRRDLDLLSKQKGDEMHGQTTHFILLPTTSFVPIRSPETALFDLFFFIIDPNVRQASSLLPLMEWRAHNAFNTDPSSASLFLPLCPLFLSLHLSHLSNRTLKADERPRRS